LRHRLRLRERFLILHRVFGSWGIAAICAFEVAFVVKVPVLIYLFT
jgi:hypothetical protein